MANQKITALIADTTPSSDDLVLTVNDPLGTPANRKVTLDDLGKGINIDNVADGTTNKMYTATEQTKLAGIETSADVTDTTNVTAAGALMDSELADLAGIKALVVSTLQVKLLEGAFVDGDKTKLDGIETGATADQTAGEIKTAYESNLDTNAYTDAEKTKLAGIETAADVTDATNVTTALGTIPVSAHSDVDTDKSKTPADGDVLTFDGTDWNAEAPAGGGGGGNPYNADIVLDAAGTGDYTTLATALAAAATNDIIFVKAGTYTTGGITEATPVTIIGEDRETVIFELATSTVTFTGNQTQIKNCRWNINQNANGRLVMNCNEYVINNCVFEDNTGASNANGLDTRGTYGQITNNIMRCTANNPKYLHSHTGTHGTIADNNYYAPGGYLQNGLLNVENLHNSVTGNNFYITGATGASISVASSYNNISGNNCRGGEYSIVVNGFWNNISSNTMASKKAVRLASGTNTVSSNTIYQGVSTVSYGVAVEGSDCVVTGNRIENGTTTAGIGIDVFSAIDNTVITGNRVTGYTTGVRVSSATCDNTVITGNNILGNTTSLSDSGTGTINSGNAA